MFIRFLYGENYKCGTIDVNRKHLIAIMGSIDLTLFIMVFDFIPSF